MAEKNKKTNKKSEKRNFSCTIPILLSSLATLGVSYYVFNLLNTPFEKPKVDLTAYWGPYPMKANPDKSIRSYSVEFSDVMVNELRSRLLHRRPFHQPLEDVGFTYGFNSNFLTKVLDYWQNKYNFSERQNFFNKYNQYVTNIQGLEIHFVHVKPKVGPGVDIVPLLLLHGWPGSFREFYELIPELAYKPEHNFALELIIPSLPGFGFSQAAVRPGMGPLEMAVVMRNLMERIGHNKYYIQGGDFGHAVGSIMATLFSDNVLGFHTNMPVVSPNTIGNILILLGSIMPSLVVEPEIQDRIYPLSKQVSYLLEESGYMHLHATKPDTVGIALTDSPAGLAAYILEKFSTWTNPENRKAADGNLLSNFTLTHLLDNVMVYWASNCITTSMRLYAENFSKRHMAYRLDMIPTSTPTWGLKSKHELFIQPDIVIKMKYKKYLHTTVIDVGGHFAAFEFPKILAKDLLQAIITFREYWSVSNTTESPQPDPLKATSVHEFTVRDIYGTKIEVNGENAHPLWRYLKLTQSGTLGDSIKWNFSKFLVDKDGVPVERFGPNVDPIDLEPYLAKYW